MIVLHGLTAMRLSGADTGDFLHNQLSADVLKLAPGQSTFACYCEPKGRVLALVLVYCNKDEYLVILSRSLAIDIAKRLRIYVMRSKVEIQVLEEITIAGLRSENENMGLTGNLAVIEIPDSNKALLLASDISRADLDSSQEAVWKLAELRAGRVWLCPETSGQFLPQMLGFDKLGAVNFRKGCYPGQEIIARTHYLGKVKRHPRLICTGAMIYPDPLDEILLLEQAKSHKAVIVDCSPHEDGGVCIFVVTRMKPRMIVEKLEYQGQEVSLL